MNACIDSLFAPNANGGQLKRLQGKRATQNRNPQAGDAAAEYSASAQQLRN
jgi:hypothetical protein